jgi:hypoxanthine phosphoribosyltransferase
MHCGALIRYGMCPRRTSVEHSNGVFEVGWAMFGELTRGLVLTVARQYDPDLVVGIATAGLVPAAVIAVLLGRDFHAIAVSHRLDAETTHESPMVLTAAPDSARGRRVLIVDDTCDTGQTFELAMAALLDAGAAEVRSAVVFQTGGYSPHFHALATDSTIVLPWDREVLVDGELLPNPLYADALTANQ